MSKKTGNVNFKISPEVYANFKAACDSQQKSISDIMRGCMMAYVQLAKKLEGKPIYTLEFKEHACDEVNRPPRPTQPPATPGAGSGLSKVHRMATSRTKELAGR